MGSIVLLPFPGSGVSWVDGSSDGCGFRWGFKQFILITIHSPMSGDIGVGISGVDIMVSWPT